MLIVNLVLRRISWFSAVHTSLLVSKRLGQQLSYCGVPR
jgi:hypothetical protein